MGKLQHECTFCGTPTNFKDEDKAYCIDCYCKLRDSAHTHKINPQPVDITPQPKINPYDPPYEIGPWGTGKVIC